MADDRVNPEIDSAQVYPRSSYTLGRGDDNTNCCYSPATRPFATEPIATPADAPPQKRKGSVFVDKSHEKESYAALTENVAGEFVYPMTCL